MVTSQTYIVTPLTDFGNIKDKFGNIKDKFGNITGKNACNIL